MKRFFRLLAFLLSLPLLSLLSLLFFVAAERPYHIGIEGCESGHVGVEEPQIFCGTVRPLTKIIAKEICYFVGNLMEDPDPNLYFVDGPAGEYSVQMGQDDGPIHYLSARVSIPAGNGNTFTVSLQGEENTTGIHVYRREDFARAYPHGYFLDKGEREPAVPLPVQAEAQGNRLEATLPFGVYMVEEFRTPRDADESANTLYPLNILRR